MAGGRAKFFTILLAAAAVVAVAGYLTEQGFHIARTPRTDPPHIPGSQQVRIVPAEAPPASDQTGQRGKGKKSRRGGAETPRVGGGERGHQQAVGNTPIPILANGQQKATIVGRDIQNTLKTITIVTATGPRTGWVVVDLLQAQGVGGAKQVVFTNKEGKHQSVDWAQLSDADTRFIVAYNQGGSLLLASGPEVDQNGKRLQGRKLKAPIRNRADLVVFPNVVKIDVQG